jgi:tyrosyl-tRNA synthetase
MGASGLAPVDRQLELLLSGAADVIPQEDLVRKLESGRPLRVKLGIDPSAPDLHLGHAVVLRKLRRFQDLGHVAILIVGDFTGRVGDPAGQSETRPMLTPEELEANAETYLEQVGIVLDLDRAEIRRNSEWLAALRFEDVARLAATQTVARLLERDDFAERYRGGKPVSLQEFLYPLMQGYDSVAIEADVEMGGTDQTFNLLVGRDIQRAHGQEPQVAFTMPLLAGTDGTRKMSKSLGNHVGLVEPPEEQFGKVMSIPDEAMPPWFRLCTDLEPAELDAIDAGLADGSLRPDVAKRRLARDIVRLYHGEDAAREAEARFDRIHREREIPDDVPEQGVRRSAVVVERKPGVLVLDVAVLLADELRLAQSRSEARRLIDQGGVRRDGALVEGYEQRLTEDPDEMLVGSVWQVGKRRYARIASLI